MSKKSGNRPLESNPDVGRALAGATDEERDGLLEVWDLMEVETPGFPESERVDNLWAKLEAHAAGTKAAGESTTEGRVKTAPDSVRPAGARRGTRRAARSMSGRPRRLRLWLGAGVSLSVAATLLFLLLPIKTVAPLGQLLTLNLPDGSSVVLNSGAELQHRRLFDRRVRLRGEAFFDVTSSPDRFMVQTDDATIEVLGTRFSVRSWNTGVDLGTTVYLEEGSVRLTAIESQQALILEPGDVHQVAGGTIETLSSADPRELALWRTSGFVYRDRLVGVILDDFARRYAVRVDASDDLRRQRMTLVIREPSADERAVLDDVASALGVRYQSVAGGYRLVE